MSATLPVYLLAKSPQTKNVLARLVAEQHGFHVVQSSQADNEPGLVIFELGARAEEDFKTIASLITDPRVDEVFITAPQKDPDLIIRAMRVGVSGFIAQPFQKDEVGSVLADYARRTGEKRRSPLAQARGGGRIIHVMGAKGGVGTTTVAVNLAVLQARRTGGKGALMDIRLPQGEVPLFLNMEYAHTWADAVRELGRLDDVFLESLVERHESGLSVLASPDENDDLDIITGESVQAILAHLRARYPVTVIDGGPYVDELALAALEMADEILFVTEMSLPSLASGRRLLDEIANLVPAALGHTRLLLNRCLEGGDLVREEAEVLLGRKVYSLIVDDYESAISALNQGRTLCDVYPRSPAAMGLMGLAERILPAPGNRGSDNGRSGGLFSRLLHIGKRENVEGSVAY